MRGHFRLGDETPTAKACDKIVTLLMVLDPQNLAILALKLLWVTRLRYFPTARVFAIREAPFILLRMYYRPYVHDPVFFTCRCR